MMGQLYDVDVRTINYHLKKVFSDKELERDSVIRNFRITAADGRTYDTQHYNLSAIIAVGYKGLTTWKDAPKGKIQKFDVSVAKIYLTENEMAQLQRPRLPGFGRRHGAA